MNEDKLFEIVRNAYNGVNTDYLKSQVLAAVAEIGLTRQEVMEGLLDWIVVGGCTGVNDRYRPYIYGALALLREQEARVMTLEEVINAKDKTDVWLDEPNCVVVAATISNWVGLKNHAVTCFYGIEHTASEERDYMNNNYNKKWRCWTSRPTEEQRKAVKWDET